MYRSMPSNGKHSTHRSPVDTNSFAERSGPIISFQLKYCPLNTHSYFITVAVYMLANVMFRYSNISLCSAAMFRSIPIALFANDVTRSHEYALFNKI